MSPPHAVSPWNLALVAGTAALATLAIRTAWNDSVGPIASPHASQHEPGQLGQLPYPPHALPGARDVDSPYGPTRVYEWGQHDGPKVLLIHGISTPSIALADLAHRLVARGFRVLLFDLFGRGYSSAPDPNLHRYDAALYSSQILVCLQSSSISWTTFTLVGYSLGGAIAADFTSYFPHRVRGLVLVAPGGLMRTDHITWKSRMMYSTRGLMPEWLVQRLVAKRLWSGPETARTIEPGPRTGAHALDHDEQKGHLRTQAVYTSSRLCLLPNNPHSTVSNVVDWQILHHKGFVPAFISSIRYAPIHNQHHRWSVIAQNMADGIGDLKHVRLVLGELDPIVIADEIIEDATKILSKDRVIVHIVKGAGHEVAIDSAEEIVGVLERMHQ